jgi:hypothetical protein
MREMRRRAARAIWVDRRSRFVTLLLLSMATACLSAAPAWAAEGYELSTSTPSRSLGNKAPHGIAVDQSSRRIYVAIVTANPATGPPGEVDRFNSDLTSAGDISVGKGYYSGVAVNPVNQALYATQAVVHTPFGTVGTGKMDLFTSGGVQSGSFALGDTGTVPQIATDSVGLVYYPDAATDSVRVFNSAGVLQKTISCSGCPGGAFGTPVSVAIDSDDNLFVADLSPDRLLKLTPSGGTYSFASMLQSGRGAVAVAVDPSTDDVFVGNMPDGKDFHIAAYDSSGVQFDDFGAGILPDLASGLGPTFAHQMAADATSHRLYVGGLDNFYVFERVTTQPPTATIKPATPVGQITAKVHALVNPRGHTVLECEFEFTDADDFQANGFANATTAPCSKAPNGNGDTPAETKISGLAPVTTYHYRVTATTFAGSVTSSGETFQTLPVTPATVTTQPALAVTQSTATLNATVNPQGGSISSCRFEYGTSTSYGSNLSCLKLPEAVAEDVALSRHVSGLAPGTEYHFRLTVTSNAGTVIGNDVAFKTTTPPQPEENGEQPPVTTTPPATSGPPPVVTHPPSKPPLRCKKGFRKKKVKGKLKCVKKKRHVKRRRAQR